MKSSLKDLQYLNGSNMRYLESLLEQADQPENSHWRQLVEDLAVQQAGLQQAHASGELSANAYKQAQVSELIMAYRKFGHLVANVDPIGTMRRGDASMLDLAHFDLTEEDLNSEFQVVDIPGWERATLNEIIAYLEKTYCHSIGYEVRYISEPDKLEWLMAEIETKPVETCLTDEERKEVLHKLTMADGLERYLHNKYVGQKRFSLEGGDALIPMMSDLIQQFGAAGVKEIVIGMAHRGRLNVLVNILGKEPSSLFREFEGEYSTENADTDTGDVKYHQGASSDIQTPGGIVHTALSFNPSHLEIINPVVEGSVRARQERRRDSQRKQVVPILIHGDAAFAGQGVVMETLQMSTTRGYSTGGTVHIIINNQIGFTTNPLDARSTLYCTEIAKMVQAPILHVNGDDADAVIRATRLAIAYREKFGGDVVLDLVCYRRHGHNEADEPAITQPMMYAKIRKHPTPREVYAKYLIEKGVMSEAEAKQLVDDYRDQLDVGHVVAGQVLDTENVAKAVDWTPFLGNDWREEVETAVDKDTIVRLATKLTEKPEDFEVHKRVVKVLEQRVKMAKGELPMDWGCAELLAYASLLEDDYIVRLSGQDCGRGTFSHRHAVLHDQSKMGSHIPMRDIPKHNDDFLVINSLLSEEAVLGFEYGFSTTEPRALVIWEAQFGDFVNGAQVVIDQFISSGQAKWSRVCALALFLPHGMEGQGPEHSSARIERFLQLCAEHNMQVCVPTTPAQMFHMLRRQMKRSFRRPLIVMTPKSLLRHKLCVSTPEDLAEGRFQSVIGEIDSLNPADVKRVVACSGKVYYDLLEERRQREIDDIAIIRVEQLHPFPDQELKAQLQKYENATQVVWCQEETKNQGAWYSISYYLMGCLQENQKLAYVGRDGSPSPAVGFYKLHDVQQKKLVNQALTLEHDDSVKFFRIC